MPKRRAWPRSSSASRPKSANAAASWPATPSWPTRRRRWWNRSASDWPTGRRNRPRWQRNWKNWADAGADRASAPHRSGAGAEVEILQFDGHHDALLAAFGRGIVIRAAADLIEALAFIQRDGVRIARPYFQEQTLQAMPARHLEHLPQQAPALAAALVLGRHADVQQMAFAGGAAEHEIADQPALPFQQPALMAGVQAVAEDAGGPRKRIGAQLHGHHRIDIGRFHQPKLRIAGLALRVHCGRRWARM